MSDLYNLTVTGGFLVDTSFNFHRIHNETVKKGKDWKVYGIPSEEKFPIDDPEHVVLAKGRFYACGKEFRKELAERILYRSLELKMKIKPEGDWFSYLSKDLQKLVTDNFDHNGLHKGKEYPTGLVPDEFLNESIQSMADVKGLFAKKILEDAGSLLAKGNTTIPEEEDLGALFENVLAHIGDVVGFISSLDKQIPHYDLGLHFGLCDPEATKREPRLEELNAYYAEILMNEHVLSKNLPASLTTVYRSTFHDRYYDIFGWSLSAFVDLIKTHAFAPGVLPGDYRKIELIPLWNEFYNNRALLGDLIGYNLASRSIFNELKEHKSRSSYSAESRKNGLSVCSSNDGMRETHLLKEGIVERAQWLKGIVTEATLNYYKTGTSPNGRSPEKWAEILTNEVVLIDIVAVAIALAIWAQYNTTMCFFDEVHPKVVALSKELVKM